MIREGVTATDGGGKRIGPYAINSEFPKEGNTYRVTLEMKMVVFMLSAMTIRQVKLRLQFTMTIVSLQFRVIRFMLVSLLQDGLTLMYQM